MKRIALTIAVALLIISGIGFAATRTKKQATAAGKLQVVASFYPLYDFARQVGGDKVQLANMTPAGAEPHDYEPSPRTIADAMDAEVLVYNGSDMEPWVADFLRDYNHTAVKASAGIKLLEAAAHEGEEAGADDHELDPHFWLDPVLAQRMVANIRDGLQAADPANGTYYRQRAQAYIDKLRALDRAYAEGLATCPGRSIVTAHQAFGYLAKRYDLDVTAIAGISTEQEPSAAKLAELSQVVREKQIRYVFFESLVGRRLADTIATETGAKTLAFDPIEGLTNAEQKKGKDYLSIQRANLQNLRIALACN